MDSELKDICQLKKEFDDLNSSDKLAYIRFYENNIDSIDNIDINKDYNHYNAKLRLFCEYGLSLVGGGLYSKGVSVLSEAIPMFENDPTQGKSELKKISYYEHLLWNYAMALWEIRKIDSSIVIFKQLVDYYPDNDKYKNWLKGLKAKKIGKITKPIWFVCLIWLIGEFTIFQKFDSKIQFYIAAFGAGLLIIVAILELYMYLVQRK